jgi:argininosuccinate lyase
MKGQPLAYNRDNQEDKEPVFDTVDTIQLCLRVYAAMFPGVMIKRDNMKEAAAAGYSTATDLADYLVRKNIPFRDAHEIVGKVVSYAIQQGLRLEQITLQQLQEFCEAIESDIFDVITLEGSVAARDHVGGTAPDRVVEAARTAGKLLDARATHPV